ncbi:cell wall-binding repeat-containing protein [Planococcus plakortidis]
MRRKNKLIRCLLFLLFVGALGMVANFFTTTFVASELEEKSVLPFGAKTNDSKDDTEYIQRTIDSFKGNNGIVYFPKGVYEIDAIKSLVIPSNLILKFQKGSVLNVIPNNSERYEVIRIHDVQNIKIIGDLEIRGEKDTHTGTSGQWGFGISIRGSKNISVENASIYKNWGDGIYIGSTSNQRYSENITIDNVKLDGNRRQGISIISGKNIKVLNSLITNTHGHPPQGGIDIEPNNNLEVVENILIQNTETNNNTNKGIIVSLKQLKGSNTPVSIKIENSDRIYDGIGIYGIDDTIGTIEIDGVYYLSPQEQIGRPLVDPVNHKSTTITGTAKVNSTIQVIKSNKVIGTSKANIEGAFKTNIPLQNIGDELSVIAIDQNGSTSKPTKIKVHPVNNLKVYRIEGQDRYNTAIEISQNAWTTSNTVILTTGEDFPDALTGGPLAYKEKAPILLTRSKSLTKGTQEEITRLKAKKVIILGSEMAVSGEIESLLKSKGLNVERLGGANRYETASIIAARLSSQKVVIGYGRNFPDILSVSSYAAKNGIPILLTKEDKIPAETKAALKGKNQTLVIGSTGVVGDEVFRALPKPVRYGGANRYETSKAIISGLPVGNTNAFIATGKNFPDALTGSVLAAQYDAPIMLVEPNEIPNVYHDILFSYSAFTILGSTGVVSSKIEEQLQIKLTE